jgi:site-specific recombinase XerD
LSFKVAEIGRKVGKIKKNHNIKMIPTPQLLNQVANFIQEQGKFSYYGLFLLGSQSGLRVSEAVNFDLNLEQKLNLYLIQGKRHKKRFVYVDPQVVQELKKNN